MLKEDPYADREVADNYLLFPDESGHAYMESWFISMD